MNTETPLATAAGVQDGALAGKETRAAVNLQTTGLESSILQMNTHLHQSPRLLAQLVVVLELNSDGFVTVQARQLHVCGVAHEEGAKEICGSDT